MAKNESRSRIASLDEGATDGGYYKARRDVEVDAFDSTLAARRTLHPSMNWGTRQESPVKVRPDGVISRV